MEHIAPKEKDSVSKNKENTPEIKLIKIFINPFKFEFT